MNQACIASLSMALTNTSRWRLNNAAKYPEDKRYERAARKLARLAEDTANLSIDQWTVLEPHFKSERWNECLRQTTRKVGFAHRKMSWGFFLRTLGKLLSEPATA